MRVLWEHLALTGLASHGARGPGQGQGPPTNIGFRAETLTGPEYGGQDPGLGLSECLACTTQSIPYPNPTYTLPIPTHTLPIPYKYPTHTLPIPYLYPTYTYPTYTLPTPYIYPTHTLPIP